MNHGATATAALTTLSTRKSKDTATAGAQAPLFEPRSTARSERNPPTATNTQMRTPRDPQLRFRARGAGSRQRLTSSLAHLQEASRALVLENLERLLQTRNLRLAALLALRVPPPPRTYKQKPSASPRLRAKLLRPPVRPLCRTAPAWRRTSAGASPSTSAQHHPRVVTAPPPSRRGANQPSAHTLRPSATP